MNEEHVEQANPLSQEKINGDTSMVDVERSDSHVRNANGDGNQPPISTIIRKIRKMPPAGSSAFISSTTRDDVTSNILDRVANGDFDRQRYVDEVCCLFGFSSLHFLFVFFVPVGDFIDRNQKNCAFIMSTNFKRSRRGDSKTWVDGNRVRGIRNFFFVHSEIFFFLV